MAVSKSVEDGGGLYDGSNLGGAIFAGSLTFTVVVAELEPSEHPVATAAAATSPAPPKIRKRRRSKGDPETELSLGT
jgi:hypothetical protein